jgi:hypothetical protein
MTRFRQTAKLFAFLIATGGLVVEVAHAAQQQLGNSGQVGQRFADLAATDTPRWPDGRVRLGAAPGEVGLWLPFNGGADRIVNPDDMAPTDLGNYADRPRVAEVPFQAWARAIYDFRIASRLEPHTRCKPSPGPRQFLTPYGVEILEMPDLERIYIFDLGGPHTYRIIHMDGRDHPEDLAPDYYGHSIGRWEGDTLVVDSRGFNERFWIDRTGLPATDRLHMIERFLRIDSKTMKYEVTIDDPGAYTAVWTAAMVLGWDPLASLFEYICQDNNLAPGLMVGTGDPIERGGSRIVP